MHRLKVKKASITILSCTPAHQMILHTDMKPFTLVTQGFLHQNKHITQVSERTARLCYCLFMTYMMYMILKSVSNFLYNLFTR